MEMMELFEWVVLQIDWIAVLDFMWNEVVVPLIAAVATIFVALAGMLRKKLIEEIQGREELSMFSDLLVGAVETIHKKSVDKIQEAKEDLLYDQTIPEEIRARIRTWLEDISEDSNVKNEVQKTSIRKHRKEETDFQVQESLKRKEGKEDDGTEL